MPDANELPRCPKCDARSSPDRCGWRDFDCRSVMDHGKFLQSDYCTQRERDALRAAVARLEGELAEANAYGERIRRARDEMHEAKDIAEAQAVAARARAADAESALAGSVPRAVALRACCVLGAATWAVSEEVWREGWIRAQVGQFPREIEAVGSTEEVWTNRAELALARALAESATRAPAPAGGGAR